mmetsp:Transcript_28830/g.81328  ORF Transcript_28830/g.81328 Transcript_28830/m.81328 type:complete len:232 (-) Transcript_28830:69-764(-)
MSRELLDEFLEHRRAHLEHAALDRAGAMPCSCAQARAVMIECQRVSVLVPQPSVVVALGVPTRRCGPLLLLVGPGVLGGALGLPHPARYALLLRLRCACAATAPRLPECPRGVQSRHPARSVPVAGGVELVGPTPRLRDKPEGRGEQLGTQDVSEGAQWRHSHFGLRTRIVEHLILKVDCKVARRRHGNPFHYGVIVLHLPQPGTITASASSPGIIAVSSLFKRRHWISRQ